MNPFEPPRGNLQPPTAVRLPSFVDAMPLNSAQARMSASQHGRPPVTTAPPLKATQRLNQRLWKDYDLERVQVMEQTTQMRADTAYDGTKLQWVGVGPFPKPLPLYRYNMYSGFLPKHMVDPAHKSTIVNGK